MRIRRITRPFILLSKLGILIFCLYIALIREIAGNNQMFFYGSTLVALVGFLGDALARGGKLSKNIAPKGWYWWFAFGLSCLVSSMLAAVDKAGSIDSLIRYFAYLFLGLAMCYISFREDSFEWFLKIFATTAVICCLFMVVSPYRIYSNRYSLGPLNNPNSLAKIVFFGLFSIIYMMKTKGGCVWFSIVLVLLCLYTLMLANSRKMIIAALFLTAIWLFYYLRELTKGKLSVQRLLLLSGILVLGSYAGIYFASTYFGSALGSRMSDFLTEDSNTSRFQMYEVAFDLFQKNPLFGIGFDEFKVQSGFGKYSHTTYGEALACTGLVGSLLFFIPVFQVGVKCCKTFFARKSYRDHLILALFISELFLGAGQIIFYGVEHIFFFMIIFMYFEKGWHPFVKKQYVGI